MLLTIYAVVMIYYFSFQDWEKKYIHPNWSQVLQDNFTLEQVYILVYIPIHVLCRSQGSVLTVVSIIWCVVLAMSRCVLVPTHLRGFCR